MPGAEQEDKEGNYWVEWSNLVLFAAASGALIVTPGPDMLYVISRGISQGRRAGMVSAAGITLGILAHTVFAALGLAILVRVSSLAFQSVKFAGAAYLIFIGAKTIHDKTELSDNGKGMRAGSRKVFFQGFLTNLLNPKVALFFLAFLPQFVVKKWGHATAQMIAFGLAYALFSILFLVFVGYFSGSVGSRVMGGPWEKTVRRLAGSVFVVLGLRLALMEVTMEKR